MNRQTLSSGLSVSGDGNAFILVVFPSARVKLNYDFTGFAWSDALSWPLWYGACAASVCVGNYQGYLPCVGECKSVFNHVAFVDGTEIVRSFIKRHYGKLLCS